MGKCKKQVRKLIALSEERQEREETGNSDLIVSLGFEMTQN